LVAEAGKSPKGGRLRLRIDRVPRGNAEKRLPVVIVTVDVALAVIAPVMVAALG
jgi:hypothetical protein